MWSVAYLLVACGMRVVTDASQPGLPIQRILSNRGATFGACEPALLVDGLPVDAEELTRFYSSNDISAIEIYQASEVPGRFSNNRSLCGVILFWTKSRVRDK